MFTDQIIVEHTRIYEELPKNDYIFIAFFYEDNRMLSSKLQRLFWWDTETFFETSPPAEATQIRAMIWNIDTMQPLSLPFTEIVPPPAVMTPRITSSLSGESEYECEWCCGHIYSLDWNPVTITLDIESEYEIKEVRYVKAMFAGGGGWSEWAHIPYNFDYRMALLYRTLWDNIDSYTSIEEYQKARMAYYEYILQVGGQFALETINLYFSNVFREPLNIEDYQDYGWDETDWLRNPENFKDFSQPLTGNELITYQNGLFLFIVEDVKGNKTIQSVWVNHIRLAEAELNITIYDEPFENDIVASVRVTNVIENPNASVVRTWIIPHSFRQSWGAYVDANYRWANSIEWAEYTGRNITPEDDGSFLITTDRLNMNPRPPIPGQPLSNWFAFVMLDEWGNYSIQAFRIIW